MSGAGEGRRPAGVRSLRVALLVVLSGLATAAAVLVVARAADTAAPVGTTPSGSVTCSPPPLPPTGAPRLPSAPDPGVAAGATWRATVTTTCGVIRLRLDGAAAPATVASFVTLARVGYWTDSVCHRLTSHQARTAFLQCGDPTGHGFGDPGYDLPLENVPAGGRYVRGMVGMARGDDVNGTAGEFFLVHRDFTAARGAPVYTVFGRVVEGQEVIDHIAARGGEDTRPDGPPFTSISIVRVDVERG